MDKKSCDMFGACCKGEGSVEGDAQYSRSLPRIQTSQNFSTQGAPQVNQQYSYYSQNEQMQNVMNNMVRNEEVSYAVDSNEAQQNYGQNYAQNYEQNYEQSYAQNYEQSYEPNYVQNYEPNYEQSYKRREDVPQYEEYQYNQGSSPNSPSAIEQYYNQEAFQQMQMQNAMMNTEREEPYAHYTYGNENETSGNQRPAINVRGDQPVFSVPVYQDKYLRNRIIEVPKYEIQDVIQPKVFTQETKHDIPTVELIYKEKPIHISQPKIVEKPVEVDVPIGYTPLYSPKWDVREVPRPVPKYRGNQKIIEVEVPQIKYIDKFVEKEIIVDVKEKIIPKVTEVEKSVDVVQYEWKEQYQDVPVYKYVPKIDVELDCPPPLIVPYPEPHFQNTAHIVNPNQTAADVPPEVLMKNVNISKIANVHVNEDVKKSLLEIARSNAQKKEKTKEKSWAFWRSKKNKADENENASDIDPETGYPKAMPKDFAHFFQTDLNTVKKQMKNINDMRSKESINTQMENMPVHPTIEYLGKIDKAPIDGGKLDAISFKLHAIEVHQFIPVPSLPKPKFLDLVPQEKIENNDISCLENVFGSVPEGWVDPNITGYLAPMMNDVLQGNIKPESPLFNKISIGGNKLNMKSFNSLNQRIPTSSVLSRDIRRNNSYETQNSLCQNADSYN